MESYDLIIIGGGLIGFNCVIVVYKEGFSYLVFEKGVFVNFIYNFLDNMIFFFIFKCLEIGDVFFIFYIEKFICWEVLEYYWCLQ